MRIKKREWESVSDYSKRQAATVIPDGGRRIKLSKSAIWRHTPIKGPANDAKVYKKGELRRYLKDKPVQFPFGPRIIK